MSEEHGGLEVTDGEVAADLTADTAADPAAERTGHPVVDDVLDRLETLEDVPVTDRVEAFESAHERLRSALADAGHEQPA